MRKLESEAVKLFGWLAYPLNLVQQGFKLVGLGIVEGRIQPRHTFGASEPGPRAICVKTMDEFRMASLGRHAAQPCQEVIEARTTRAECQSAEPSEICANPAQLTFDGQVLTVMHARPRRSSACA
jgi:hypothetical protein